MKTEELNKVKKLIETIEKKVLNKQLFYYIVDDINSCLNKETNITVNDNIFKGINKRNNTSLIVENYSISDDISAIYVTKENPSTKLFEKIKIEFQNNLVSINRVVSNSVVDFQRHKVVSHEKKKEEYIYSANELIYSKKSNQIMSLNISDDSDYYEEEIRYINKDRKCAIKKTIINEKSPLNSGCNYVIANNYEAEKFNNINYRYPQRQTNYANSSVREFSMIRNSVLDLLKTHSPNKTKKLNNVNFK